MTTMSKTRTSSGGFTLIELVAVLTIVAILAGAASLSLRGPYQTATPGKRYGAAHDDRSAASRTRPPLRTIGAIDDLSQHRAGSPR